MGSKTILQFNNCNSHSSYEVTLLSLQEGNLGYPSRDYIKCKLPSPCLSNWTNQQISSFNWPMKLQSIFVWFHSYMFLTCKKSILQNYHILNFAAFYVSKFYLLSWFGPTLYWLKLTALSCSPCCTAIISNRPCYNSPCNRLLCSQAKLFYLLVSFYS